MPTPTPDSSPTQTAPLSEGSRVAAHSLRKMGRYELVAEVGRGGMGVVYRAWDPELNRDVALKVLAAHQLADDGARTRFLREARAAARLEHPGIVRVYDIGEDEGNVYFTMPLVIGPTLSARLKEGPIPPETAAAWTAQIARALHHAHRQGLIHRDVKPGNILLEGGERPLLTDFGLVRQYERDEAALTRESQVLGTPAYMSPEQAMGDTERMGPLSDQYSLGVVLYEQLTGERLFKDTHPAAMLRRILEEEAPPITRPSVPRAVAAIAERAVARIPFNRYVDCEAMAEDLERFLRGESVLANTTTTALKIQQALRRHRRPLGSVGRLILLGVGLVGLLALGLRWRERREAEDRAAAAEARRVQLEARLGELFAAGKADQAEAQFAAFSAFEANQETPALGLAWRGLGALRARHGDVEGALDAYANAWLLTEGDEPQVSVLTELAELLRAQHHWTALGAVAETLERLGAPQTLTAKAWRRDLALVRGDVKTALALSDDPSERTIIERLTLATETGHQGQVATRLDLDEDGVPELLLLRRDDPDIQVLDTRSPRLPLRHVLRGLADRGPQILGALPTVPGQPPIMFIGWTNSRIYRWDGDQMVQIEEFDTRLTEAASGDIDKDGQIEHYVPSNDLYRFDVQGEALRISSASQEHRATRSSAHSIAVDDLDGDGQDELIVGTGTWTGYDVRILKPGAKGLEIVTRRRIGETFRVKTLRTAAGKAVVAWRSSDPREVTNRQMFRPDELEGEERGLHVLTLGPQGLSRRAVYPQTEAPILPSAAARAFLFSDRYAVHTGDLDGDGLDEVIIGSGESWTLVMVQHADGHLSELNFPGYLPQAVLNLDADPEMELVVMRTDATQSVWALGVGDQPLPLEAVTPTAVRTPPEGLSRDLASAWDRAEALVAIGRTRAAAQRLEALADMAQDDATITAGLERAAELYASLEENAQASALFMEVARSPERAPAALEAALAAALDGLDLTRALEAGAARLALPSPPSGLEATVNLLERALARTEHTYNLRQGLDPVWHVRTPIGIQHRPTLGLEVLSAERAALLDLPVQWDGGPLRVSLELEVSRLDWGGMLSVGLIAPGSEPLEENIVIASGGGAGVLEQAVRCGGVLERFHMPRHQGTLTGRPLRVTLEVDPTHRRIACALEGAGALDGRHVNALPSSDLNPGRLVLRVGGNPAYDSQARVLLKSVALRGLEPLLEPAGEEEAINRLLALDRAAEALDALADRREVWAELARAQALVALGRRAEASASMRLALRQDPELNGELGRVLRGALEPFERDLRAHFGDAFPLRLWQHSFEVLMMHGEEAPAQELLTRYFAGVEDLDPARQPDDAARLELAEILLRRAAAWRRDGRSTAALQDLARSEAIAAGVLAKKPSLEDEVGARRQLSAACRERALLYLSRGEDTLAMTELLRGLAESPAPTVFADLLVANPEFDPLWSRPEWPQIESARRVWTDAATLGR